MADREAVLRENLYQLLSGAEAHVDVLTALKGFPPDLYGKKPPHAAHTGWELLEHIRIALHDLWDFSTNPEYVEQKWPDDYWPAQKAPAHAGDWKKSLEQIAADRKAFIGLLHKAEEEIYTPFPYGNGQSLLREALLIVDHTSYHTGEIIVLRRLLKNWK